MSRRSARPLVRYAAVVRCAVVVRCAAVVLALALGSAACGFVDLRPVSLSTVPSEAYAVLGDARSPVILRFGTEMVRHEAERALLVSSPRGSVEGDLVWKGNELRFHPVAPWSPGVPYRLSVSASIRAADGRELRPSVDIPFFALSRSPAPIVSAVHPPDGASVGTEEAEGGFLRLSFSRPMDRRSVEDALSVDGVSAPELLWDDDLTLRLIPRKPLLPWTVYRWRLGEKARSADDVPLARGESGSFSTDLDHILPAVLSTFTALRSGPSWVDSGLPLAALDVRGAVGIRFSKPMDGSSLERALRLDPSVSGRVEAFAADAFVFIPERNLDGGTVYTAIVSADAADVRGLRLGREYRESFAPAVPNLALTELWADGDAAALPAGPYAVLPAEPDGLLALNLRFSHPFSGAARASAPSRVSLDPYFPGTLSAVSLRSARWISADTLRMEWVGLERSGAGVVRYYRLSIPGGRGGVENGAGLLMSGDYALYLETLP